MPILHLALQGGGSHGAFTWGVLDALLADPRLTLQGVSGTSAGAVNAVALASGHARALAAGDDPRAGARAALARLWTEIATWRTVSDWQLQLETRLWGGLPPELAPTNLWLNAFRGVFSPAQANPLDLNPLRALLEREIDFEAIASHPGLKVFVAATQVRTGQAVIFAGRQINVQAVLASACLPLLFKAVEIDGEAYWDGGYSANPALAPLIGHGSSADLMVVQLNPLARAQPPHTASQILDRVNELTFNASLLAEMRSIERVNRLLADGALQPGRHQPVRLHRIDGGEALQAWPASTKTSTDAAMIRALFEAGQTAAGRWLARHYEALGRHGTVEPGRKAPDPSPPPVSPATGAALPRGPRAWLARQLRRLLRHLEAQ